MTNIVFFNVGWMNYYDGISGDSLSRGGSYNDSETGHEVCNFSDVGGTHFGYVRATSGTIKIEKIGAQPGADSVTGITVVWTAGPPEGGTVVVGWYRDAIVYRHAQKVNSANRKLSANGITHFQASASVADSRLIASNVRRESIPRGVKGGIGHSNVWYADSVESKAVRERIASYIEGIESSHIPDIDLTTGATEGGKKLRSHLQIERNPRIIQQKKAHVKRTTGSLRCEACSFDFATTYGEIGENFCEVHHLKPLSKNKGLVETKLEDLAIVCSNCHRIIHRHREMPTLNEFKKSFNP